MLYDKLLDKKEYADIYFNALHNSGILVTPPYTYSYIMAHDSIKAVEKNNRTGFMMYPFKHFILPTYTEKDGFNNSDCIFAPQYSLGRTKSKITSTQVILNRDYTLMHYRKLGDKLHGEGKPVLFNKKELKWYLNNRRVLNYDDCLFQKDGGQHFYLYEIDGMKLLIIWDDYYSSSINIIGMSQLVEQFLQHKKFEHPYTVLQVYIQAICSFFRMFPYGTLFNATIETIRGVINDDRNIYIPLKPVACFNICTTLKDEIKEKVRIYTKYSRERWSNSDKNKTSNHYSLENEMKERKKPKNVKRKKKRKTKRKVRRKKRKPIPKRELYTREKHRHIRRRKIIKET